MREALGRAMNAEDLSPQEYECAVDRLGALAFGDGLGSSLLWVMLAGERDKLKTLAHDLAARLACRTNVTADCLRIAILAITEHLYPNCRVCNGAASVKSDNGVLVDCLGCSGTGLHYYRDEERAKITGFSWRPRLSRLVNISHQLLTAAEINVIVEVRRQLERTA